MNYHTLDTYLQDSLGGCRWHLDGQYNAPPAQAVEDPDVTPWCLLGYQTHLQAGLGGCEGLLSGLILRGRPGQQHVGDALAEHERAPGVPLLRVQTPSCNVLSM